MEAQAAEGLVEGAGEMGEGVEVEGGLVGVDLVAEGGSLEALQCRHGRRLQSI